jgi:hypothetical protein
MYADGDAPVRRRALPQNFDNPYYNRMRAIRRPYEGDMAGQQQQPQQQILANLVPDAAGNVDIWAHDETAQAGRTYRYRLRAIIKNPMFDTNVGAKPEMNKAPYLPADLTTGGLDMASAWSEWSKQVAIPTNVDMMLVSASNLGGKETAKFRVKRFQEGQINEAMDGAGKPKPFEAAPGDTIGGMEKVPGVKTPVDFTTSWMLVDIRQAGAGGDYRVRIMDAQGRMEVRTVSGDRGKFKDDAPKPGVGAAGAVGLLQRPPQN